jgi:oligosaccharide repeat unit polymerase
MIYIPFIWFILLLFYILKRKKRLEISALITIAYVITSFFAIVIDVKQIYGAAGVVQTTINLTPTLLYCFLITLTILPFIKLPTFRRENGIRIRNLELFNIIFYFYFGVFVLFVFFFGKEIIYKVQNPDIAGLRLLIVEGEDDLGFSNYTGVLRIIARLVFIFGSSAMFLHVFYFYSIAFLTRSAIFNIGILIFSGMPIMIGMLSLDRSKVIYWIMSFIAVAVFFWHSIDSSKKKGIKSTFILFLCVFGAYLTVITLARYGEQDIGAENSLIIYAGQSFHNFCLFYDKLNLPGISLEHVTPVLNSIFGSSDDISRADLYSHSIDTQVFASFSGMMIREIGVWGSVMYSFLYFVIASLLLRKIRNYNITNIVLVVILLYIPYFGIFGLYYSSLDRELAVWGILILSYFLNKRKPDLLR